MESKKEHLVFINFSYTVALDSVFYLFLNSVYLKINYCFYKNLIIYNIENFFLIYFKFSLRFLSYKKNECKMHWHICEKYICIEKKVGKIKN